LWQEYEDKALFFAKNPTALNDLKQKLKTQIIHSSLFKPDQFARNLEQRYQLIWQTYQAKID
jgi:predicted O-linked N-acetylglucosamine transferase (SPINDLY family)